MLTFGPAYFFPSSMSEDLFLVCLKAYYESRSGENWGNPKDMTGKRGDSMIIRP